MSVVSGMKEKSLPPYWDISMIGWTMHLGQETYGHSSFTTWIFAFWGGIGVCCSETATCWSSSSLEDDDELLDTPFFYSGFFSSFFSTALTSSFFSIAFSVSFSSGFSTGFSSFFSTGFSSFLTSFKCSFGCFLWCFLWECFLWWCSFLTADFLSSDFFSSA